MNVTIRLMNDEIIFDKALHCNVPAKFTDDPDRPEPHWKNSEYLAEYECFIAASNTTVRFVNEVVRRISTWTGINILISCCGGPNDLVIPQYYTCWARDSSTLQLQLAAADYESNKHNVVELLVLFVLSL